MNNGIKISDITRGGSPTENDAFVMETADGTRSVNFKDLAKVIELGTKGTSLRYRYNWVRNVEYVKNKQYVDLVAHNKSLWVCNVTNTGEEPVKGSSTWELVAQGLSDNEMKAIEDAANLANNAANDLIAKRDNGEFNGKDGRDGVITTMNGQFALCVENGHLILYYPTGDTPPDLRIEDGHLKLYYKEMEV